MSDGQIKSDPGWVSLHEAPFRLQFGAGSTGQEHKLVRIAQYGAGSVSQFNATTDSGSHAVYIRYEDKNGAVGTSFLVGLGEYLGIDANRSITEFATEGSLITNERAHQVTERVLRRAAHEGRLRLRARERLNGPFIDVTLYGLPELKITNWVKGWGEYSTGEQVFDLQVAMTSSVSPQQADSGRSDPPSAVPKNKGGRPSIVHWPTVEAEVIRLMTEHRPFSDDDPEWNKQARLEEKLLDFCSHKFGKYPGPTTLREHLPAMLKAWQQSRSET